MIIKDLAQKCLGGYHNTVSVERPIDPGTPNEIIFSGKFYSGLMPVEIQDMKFLSFSIQNSDKELRADITIYVE